jgi:hypothetical protein
VVVPDTAVDGGRRQHAIVQADPVVTLVPIDHDRGYISRYEFIAVLVDLHAEDRIHQ